MMVKIAELKSKLSSYVARVQTGLDFIVTNHGKAVARLVPIDETKTIAPRSKKHVGKIPIPRFEHSVRSIDDLFADRRRDRKR